MSNKADAPAPAGRNGHDFLFAAVGLTILGFGLRFCAARGDLWIDETWSLTLVSKLQSAGEVFWAIPHDNNHYLNSLWMYWLGQDASPLAYRLPAVLLGAASVPAAGLATRRSGPLAATIAMFLVATAYVTVEYGSQARGYSGLIFFELLAIAFARDVVEADRPAIRRRGAWGLGASLGLGLASQFLTLMVLAGLGLWIARSVLADERYSWKPALARLAAIFLPAALFMAPTMAFLVVGLFHFHLGNRHPFDAFSFWEAYGALLVLLAGVYEITPAGCFTALGVTIAGLCLCRPLASRGGWLYALFLLGVPLLFFAAHLPNSNNVRYFLPCGIVFLLGLSVVLGAAIQRSPRRRSVALAALLFIATGNAMILSVFYRDGRGDYAGLVRHMTQAGAIRYGTNQPEAVRAVLDHYAAGASTRVVETPPESWCADPPGWFVFSELAPTPPDTMADQVRQDCELNLSPVPFPTTLLSGAGWRVFRVDPHPGD